MADIRLTRPAAGEIQNIACTPEALFIFDFPTGEGTLSRAGDNLVITFDDGGSIRLENFYTAYSSENMPSFSVDGAEIAGEDFFMAMNEPDLMPAAGPGRAAGQGNGNRFHDYVNASLLDGLDRLGGLDVGWGDGEISPDLDGGGGDRGFVDFGVTVTPETPGSVDPSVPVLDDPTYPDQPGWEETVIGRDVLKVKESDLDGKGSRSVDHGELLIDAGDGVASIVIDGVSVFEGLPVPVTHYDAQVRTDEGYLTHFTFDALTGRLEYDYVLTDATQEHGAPGRDSIAHNFHVTVTDSDGDTGNGLISVVIEDDVPEAFDDAAGLEENGYVSGNVVSGTVDLSGAEGGVASGVADDYGADGAASSGSVAWNLEAWGKGASYDASAGAWRVETDYGTALLYDNGDFTFTAKKNAGLDEGVSADVHFDYTITDADGDTSSAALTVTVTGDTQPAVSFGPEADSGSVTVDEALIPDAGNAENADDHAPAGEGSFTVNLKGEGGTLTLAFRGETVTLRLDAGASSAAPSGNAALHVQGVTVTVAGASFDNASGLWNVKYSYELDKGQTHPDPEAAGAGDALSGRIDITVTDDTDDVAAGHIDVTVHDDAPLLTVGSLGNEVSVSFGADNDGTLTVEAFDANGNPIEWTAEGEMQGSNLNRLAEGESWTDGNIIVTREGNNFTFTLVTNGQDAGITVKATDADGDSTVESLTLTAPAIGFPETGGDSIIVDEALLADGSGPSGYGDGHNATGEGSFTVDLHGEAGNIVLDDGAGNSITILENGVPGSFSQSLTVQGVKVTVTGAENASGKWTVFYEYELTGEQAHTNPETADNIGAGDFLSGRINITVTDAAGEKATGHIDVTVHDDGPALTGVMNATESDALLNESTAPLVVRLDGFHTGADMVNGAQLSTVTVQVTGEGGTASSYTFTVQGSAGGGYKFSPVTVGADGSYTPTDCPVDIKKITDDAESGYHLEYTRPGSATSETPSYTFTVTVTDADGDSVMQETTVTTKDRPDISFGTDAGNGEVKEAGVEGCEIPAESENPSDPNADVPGVSFATGSMTLTDTDSESLTLNLAGTVTRTDNSETHENTADAEAASFSLGTGSSLTLYLNAEGKLVSDEPRGDYYYGTLTLDFSGGKEGAWRFDLADNPLVDALKEGESFTISLKLTATDGEYTSKPANLTVTIEGTNDRPVIALRGDEAVFDGAGNEVENAAGLREAGVATGEDGESTSVSAITTLTGSVEASDLDADNGGGASTTEKENHGLIFSLTGGTSTLGGSVATAVVNGDGSVSTAYGTLTMDAFGNYTYGLKRDADAVNSLAQGETVTESFTVRVTDKHGSFSEQTITVIIEGTNDAPTLTLNKELSVMESGVGRDESGDAYISGTDEQENTEFTGKDESETGQADGQDADHGAVLTYGVAWNKGGQDAAPLYADAQFAENGAVSEAGEYGNLILNADGSYRYVLAEQCNGVEDGGRFALVNKLNEDETVQDTFILYVKDEHGAWHSQTVTVTITGTNDRPEIALRDDEAVFDGAGKEVENAAGLREEGVLTGEDGITESVSAITTLTGSVEASDIDAENGGGASTTTTENYGLTFSLTGGTSTLGGSVANAVVNVDGSVSTAYGTLTMDAFGNYTYGLKRDADAVDSLAQGETVTESFTVRVTDARGAWSETTVTITITGTDDKPVLQDKSSALTVWESGVWGDLEAIGDMTRPSSADADTAISEPLQSDCTQTVTFDKVDANDTHSLIIDGALPEEASLAVSGWGNEASYTITPAGKPGVYTVTAVIPGINESQSFTLGSLTLEQNSADTTLTYTFTPDQEGLQNIPQGVKLDISLSFKVQDNHGTLSDAAHNATITIIGANDRPQVSVDADAAQLYASGVGRNENGTVVTTNGANTLNPGETDGYTTAGKLTGTVLATDPDAGDSTTFFIASASGKNDLTCTINDNTLTVTLSGETVGTLVLDSKKGNYTFTLDEAGENPLKDYAEGSTFSFTVNFQAKDSHDSTSTNQASVTITLTATNDAPTISAADNLYINEGVARISDKVTASDADKLTTGGNVKADTLTYGLLSEEAYAKLAGEGESAPSSVTMQPSIDVENWGTLKINAATGEYTFYLDRESASVAALREGEEHDLTFHVVVRDDKGAYTTKEITVTVTGKASSAVFVGSAAVGIVQEEGVLPDNDGNGENEPVAGTPTASGALQAVAIDHDDQGQVQEVVYFVKAEGSVTSDDITQAADISGLSEKAKEALSVAEGNTVTKVEGTYGTLYLNNQNGRYFYQLDNERADALAQGKTGRDSFTIHAEGEYDAENEKNNGADQQLTISVQGTNDAPVVSGVTLGEEFLNDFTVSSDADGKFTVSGLKEDVAHSVSGSVTADDVDSDAAPEGFTYLIKVKGADGRISYLGTASDDYGYLTLEENGAYTFTLYDNDLVQALEEGQQKQASFTIVVKDQHGAVSEEKELVFNIEGTKDAASINNVSLSTTEDADAPVSGGERVITISDADAGAKEFTSVTFTKADGQEISTDLTSASGSWPIDGAYGTLTLTKNEDGSLSYSYKLSDKGRNNLQYLNERESDGMGTSVKETFTLTGMSGIGTEGQENVTGTITVTIKGENDAPHSLTWSAAEGTTVNADGSLYVPQWDTVGGTAEGADIDNLSEDLRYFVKDGESGGDTGGDTGGDAPSIQTVKGTYGYLTINAESGEFTYTVDPLCEAYQNLSPEGNGKETFTLVVADPYGETKEKTVTFDVHYWPGDGPQDIPTLKEPETPVTVQEDGGNYFKTDETGTIIKDAAGNPIDLTPPPSVDSGWNILLDESGNPVENINPSSIYLVDNGGKFTHVVNTAYGSLILEQGTDESEQSGWGYRFVLDNNSPLVQAMDEGQKETLTFYVQTSSMEEPVAITVQVSGLNDRPVIESSENLVLKDVDNSATPDNKESRDEGSLTTSDVDTDDVGSTEVGNPNLSYGVSMAGEYGKKGYTLERKADTNVYVVKDEEGFVWGEFSLNQNGSYSFEASEGAKKLLAGENEVFKLTLTATDDSGKPNHTASTDITVTIQGTNEEPQIGLNDTSLTVQEDTTLTATKDLDVRDDRQDAEGNPLGMTYTVAHGGEPGAFAAGKYGSLYVKPDGTYTYQLNNQLQAVQELTGGPGDILEETFTIYVTDKDGAEEKEQVVVTIAGTNDAPVLTLSKPVLTVQEGSDAAVTGNASATDVDNGDTARLTYAFTDTEAETVTEGGNTYSVVETVYGTFKINTATGEYTFTLNNESEAVKNLRPTDVQEVGAVVQVSDGRGGSTTQNLTVHITGTATAPEVTDITSVTPGWTDTEGQLEQGWSGEIFTGAIEATGWDAGPDGSYTDTLSYALEGSHPETVGGTVWRVVEGEKGTLYLNPATGAYRYEPFGNAETLSARETWSETFKITLSDSTGLSTSAELTVTITGSNQDPTIASNTVAGNRGTLIFSDIDAKDTHTVTFSNLKDAEGKPLSVETGPQMSPVDVYNEGSEKIGSLSFAFTQGEGNQGNKLVYTFTPDKDYANSLNVGGKVSVSLNVTVTDSEKGSASLENDTVFTITNQNDAPVIDDASDVTPGEDGAFNGTLIFSDADAKDSHTVTFSGLYDEQDKPLSVETGSLTQGPVDVYNADGVEIGSLSFIFTQGNQGNTLSYTFTPADDLNKLPVGENEVKFTVQVEDANGLTDEADFAFTVINENDKVAIPEGQNPDIVIADPGTDTGPVSGTGSFTFTDADAGDTHTVALPEKVKVTLPGGEQVEASVEDGTVSYTPEGGETITLGTLSASVLQDSIDGAEGTVSYTFTADEGYISGLGEGESATIAVDLTVKDSHDQVSQTVEITLQGKNDAPVIDDASDVTPGKDGAFNGTLIFSDADAKDSHTVTFSGLRDKLGNNLSVETGPLPQDPVDVYNAEGVKIGSLSFTFTQGNQGNTLSYTFTPADDLNELPVGENEVNFTVQVKDANGLTDEADFAFTVINEDNDTLITPVAGQKNTFTLSDADTTDSIGAPVITAVTAELEGLQDVSYAYSNNTLSVTFTDTQGYEVTVDLGTLALSNTDGSWSYTFAPEDGAANQLPTGSSVSITGVTVGVTTTHADNTTDTTTASLAATDLQLVGTNAMVGYEPDTSLTAQDNVSGSTSFTLPEKATDRGGDALTYTWRAGNAAAAYVALDGGTFTLTEAGLLAFARSIADGKNFTLDFFYDVTDGVNAVDNRAFTLTLDGSGVDSVAVGSDVWRFGSEGVDSLAGGAGSDMLFGGAGNDLLHGMDGNDLLFGDGDTSTLGAVAGALGMDAGDVTAESLWSAVSGASGEALESLISSVEGTGTDGSDTLDGGAGSDVLFGMGGDDILEGGAGDDMLFGGAGDDYLDGGAGQDTLYGGSGNDIMVYDSADFLIDGGEGVNVLLADVSDLGGRTVDDLLSGIDSAEDGGPIVRGFDIVITGDNIESLGLTSMEKLGITVSDDAQSVTLTGWQPAAGEEGVFTYNDGGMSLTLETNLTPVTPPDTGADDAVQAQVFQLQHGQG